MKKLRILASLVGIFAVFSLTYVSAVEKNVTNVKQDEDNSEYVFAIYDFEEIYEKLKQNESFNKNFFLEVDAVARCIWKPYLPWLKVNKVYDDKDHLVIKYPSSKVSKKFYIESASQGLFGELVREKFLEDVAKNYFSFKEPVRFDEKFKDKVTNLKFIRIFELIFKYDKRNFNTNVNFLTFRKYYVRSILKELSKIFYEYRKYKFKITDFGVVCLSEDEEGRDLEDLINYCICVLRFAELIEQNPYLIDEWYEFRKANDSYLNI